MMRFTRTVRLEWMQPSRHIHLRNGGRALRGSVIASVGVATRSAEFARGWVRRELRGEFSRTMEIFSSVHSRLTGWRMP